MEPKSQENNNNTNDYNLSTFAYISHYGTRPSRCPAEVILHYASHEWPRDCLQRSLHKSHRHVISSVFSLFSLLEAPLFLKGSCIRPSKLFTERANASVVKCKPTSLHQAPEKLKRDCLYTVAASTHTSCNPLDFAGLSLNSGCS